MLKDSHLLSDIEQYKWIWHIVFILHAYRVVKNVQIFDHPVCMMGH